MTSLLLCALLSWQDLFFGLWKLLPLLLKRRLFWPALNKSLILLQRVGAKRRKIGQISCNKLANHLYMCHSTLGAVAIWVHCPQLLDWPTQLDQPLPLASVLLIQKSSTAQNSFTGDQIIFCAFASLGFCCSFRCLSTVQSSFCFWADSSTTHERTARCTVYGN